MWSAAWHSTHLNKVAPPGWIHLLEQIVLVHEILAERDRELAALGAQREKRARYHVSWVVEDDRGAVGLVAVVPRHLGEGLG